MKQKITALICAATLIISGTSSVSAEAATKPVKLAKSSLTLTVGKSKTIKVKKADKVAIKKKTFSSTKKSVATVTKNGKVKAKKVGFATIKVKVKYKKGKKVKTTTLYCYVDVTETSSSQKNTKPTSTSNSSTASSKPTESPRPTETSTEAPTESAKPTETSTEAPTESAKPTQTSTETPTETPTQDQSQTTKMVQSISTQYDDAVVKKSKYLNTKSVIRQLGKITIHYSDGSSEELEAGDDDLVLPNADSDIKCDVTGDYKTTLKYDTFASYTYPANYSKEIKVSVAEESTYNDFLYASNGEIAKVYEYKGDANDIVIPNSINGAEVVSGELEDGVSKTTSDDDEDDRRETEITSITLPKGQRYGVNFDGYYEDSYYNSGFCNIEAIYVDKDNVNLTSEDGVLFNKSKTTLEAFPRNKKTKSYVIPSTVKQIGGSFTCFYNTGKYLESVTIPSSVQIISDGFKGEFASVSTDTALKEIIVDDNNEYYESIDGVLYHKKYHGIIRYPSAKQDKVYKIPEGVTYAEQGSIYYNPYIETIIVPDLFTEFNHISFGDCSNLKNIYINEQLTDESVTKMIEDDTYYKEVIEPFILDGATIYVRSEKMRNYILTHYNSEDYTYYDNPCVISSDYDW